MKRTSKAKDVSEHHQWVGAVAGAIKKGMTLEEAQKNVTMVREFPYLVKNVTMPDVVPMNVAGIYNYLKNKAK